MLVREIMSRDVDVLGPDVAIIEAARHMRDRDIGSIPVAENDRLIGMVTDRDIVVRWVANGDGAGGRVRDAMTEKVRYCYENEDIKHVARNMSAEEIRRLPVLDRNKRLVGIVSLGDIAKANERAAGQTLEAIAEAPDSTERTGDGYAQGAAPL